MSDIPDAETAMLPTADDLLAKHFGPRPPPVRVAFGAASHAGKVRSNNEDHYLVLERRRVRKILLTNLAPGALRPAEDVGYVMAVADGLGGAAFGELASALALQSAWEQQPHAVKWSWIITDREIEELRERLELVFHRINQGLQELARTRPEYAGMGTTLTAAYTVGPEAFVGHAGDSRAYLFRNSVLGQVTRDHTLGQACLDADLPGVPRSWHHVLSNALGGTDQGVQVDFHHIHLADGDRLLLCSDGLTDMVPDTEIAAILACRAEPQATAEILVAAALDGGGKDNVTVIVADYSLVETSSQDREAQP